MDKSKTCTVIVKEDIIKADFFGPGDAYDYCVANNLFHTAYKKGDELICLLSEWEHGVKMFDKGWRSSVQCHSEERIRAYRKKKRLKTYEETLKCLNQFMGQYQIDWNLLELREARI